MFDQLLARNWSISAAETAPVLTKPLSVQIGMLVVLTTLALGIVGYAMVSWRRTGRSELFWVSLGALAAVFYEPLGDSLVGVLYHQSGALTAIAGWGHTIPLWVLPCYLLFWGPGLLSLMKILDQAPSRRRWMTLYALSVPATWLFEVVLLALGLYTYFGNQPAMLLGYPLWMAFSNSAVIFVAASIVFACTKTAAVSARPVLLTFIVPCTIIGVGVPTLLPIAYAMSLTDSSLLINLGAAGSAVLSTVMVWVAYKLVLPAAQPDAVSGSPAQAVQVPDRASGRASADLLA